MKTKSVKELQRQFEKVEKLNMPEADKRDTLDGLEGEISIASANEVKLNGLVTLEGWDTTRIFTEQKNLDLLLETIGEAARSIVWDASTPAGRKEGASIARKVSSAKVTADAVGKKLTDDWAKKKKAVDVGRAHIRKFCDDLRDEIKAPIEEWKAEEARKEAEAKSAKEFTEDHEEALSRNDLYDREAVVRKAEEAIAADKLKAEENEREEQREAAIKAREEQARVDAIEQERKRALDEDARIKLADQARARNKEHRRSVNQGIVTNLVAAGVDEDTAKKVVTAIATGMIPSVIIQY